MAANDEIDGPLTWIITHLTAAGCSASAVTSELPLNWLGALRLGNASAGTGAATLPYLGNLVLELVEEIIGCAADNPIANQEHRRAFQIELHGKFLVLVERFFDVGICVSVAENCLFAMWLQSPNRFFRASKD